jgi:mono/diheme cytochrome c family protein
MKSPADVVTLEESQLPRKARTREELQAQAYLLGNCAHCHNPRGFPSLSKPELSEALNFMPDRHAGGVFEFPLERMSPVRFRGANGDVPMPYITPSVADFPVLNAGGSRIDNGSDDGLSYMPKGLAGVDCDLPDDDNQAINVRPFCGHRRTGPAFVFAPWRSLIYRNVDTPFNYFDDYVPFPHMPMHTPGFDCRAPRIMGDWMVGLPAVRKLSTVYAEEQPPDASFVEKQKALVRPFTKAFFDDSPQPYAVVAPGDPAYEAATLAARKRLSDYHESVRYGYCEEDLSPDIYDPTPNYANGSSGYRPDTDRSKGISPPPSHPSGEFFKGLPVPIQPAIGIPFHSHFFPYDPTDTPPPWSPRRPEWKAILADRQPDMSLPAGVKLAPEPLAQLVEDRKVLVDALNEASLTADLRKYATTAIPLGLWKEKPACAAALGNVPKVESFTGDAKPVWMRDAAPAAPVYMSSPGQFLYRTVCFNCHGPRADGRGLQADALAAASEGEARPANFRNGFFGPMASIGENFRREFGGGDADVARNWASRYLAWMSLGGTLKRIPRDIVHLVEATTVLGEKRANLNYLPGVGEASGNMLNLAKGLCSIVLPDSTGYFSNEHDSELEVDVARNGSRNFFYPPFNHPKTPFIAKNGDRDLWLHLCTQYSPVVVRVYEWISDAAILGSMYYVEDAAPYPTDAPVLDHERRVTQGIQKDNLYPACYRVPTDPAQASRLASSTFVTALKMPPCPGSFLDRARVLWRRNSSQEDSKVMRQNQIRWQLRGAIATGMTVFSYLEAGTQFSAPPPAYDECQLLK